MMQTMELNTWVPIWLDKREGFVKESTMQGYREAAAMQILPALGAMPLTDITEAVVQETVLHWLREGRADGRGGLGERTVRRLVGILKLMLRDAAKAGYAVHTVMDIRYPPAEEVAALRVLSHEEQALLTQHVYLELSPKTLGIALALHTGLRIGELCALRWGDIDLAARTLTVRHTIQRIYRRGEDGGSTALLMTTPKTRTSARTVPLSTLLLPLLRRMDPGDPEVYVLTGKRTPTEPRTYRDYFGRLLQRLGIEHVRFHALRHTFATRLIESGADHKTVSELLGHASVGITLDLYVHPQMEQKRRAVELLGTCL